MLEVTRSRRSRTSEVTRSRLVRSSDVSLKDRIRLESEEVRRRLRRRYGRASLLGTDTFVCLPRAFRVDAAPQLQ